MLFSNTGWISEGEKERGWQREDHSRFQCNSPLSYLLLSAEKKYKILDLYYRIFLLPNLSNKQFLQRVLTHSRMVWI